MIKPMLAHDFHKDLSQRKIKKYDGKFFVQGSVAIVLGLDPYTEGGV